MFLNPFRKSLSAGLAACAALVLGFGFILSSAPAQDSAAAKALERARIDAVLNGLNRGRPVGQVAVAPDGKRLAWIEGAEIRVAPLDDLTKSERVTAAARPEQHCHEGGMVWAPDGKALAFFSDCAQPDEQSDLYIARLDGKPARRLTALKGDAGAAVFSPDGRRVAFLYVEGATRPAGALAAMKPPSGVIGEEGVEIQRVAMVTIPTNWNGEQAPTSNRPMDSREMKNLTPLFSFATAADLYVYEFDWRPDSKALAYVAADPPGENNWWVAKLYTQELERANPAPAKVVLAPSEVAGPLHGLQIAVPRWSPDGQAIAFIGGLMSDQGVTGGDVWIVSAAGGPPRNLTPHRHNSPAWMEWDDNDHIFVSEIAGGNCQLVRMKLQGDRTSESVATSFSTPIFNIPGSAGDGRMEVSLSSTADRSLFVFRANTFDRAPEIYAARTAASPSSRPAGLAALAQLSHINDGEEPAWGKSVSLTWKSDAFQVQGWLLLPLHYDPRKKYPLIVEVHGGPVLTSVPPLIWSAMVVGAVTQIVGEPTMVTVLGVESPCGPKVRPPAPALPRVTLPLMFTALARVRPAPSSCKVPPLRVSGPVPRGPATSAPPETVLLAPICSTPPARLVPPL